MYDTLGTASTQNSEPSRQCPLCKKTFVKGDIPIGLWEGQRHMLTRI